MARSRIARLNRGTSEKTRAMEKVTKFRAYEDSELGPRVQVLATAELAP